jgi:hypothetical protein
LNNNFQKSKIIVLTPIDQQTYLMELLSQDLYLCKALHKFPILCNNGRIYHCHLSRDFPRFSDGKRFTKREASLVTLRDQIARLAKPTTPYLGHIIAQFVF